jgi:hypothetical protein
MPRAEAAAYLTKLGLPRAPGTLKQEAYLGTGCRYFRVGGHCFYSKADLDAYAKTQVYVCEPATKVKPVKRAKPFRRMKLRMKRRQSVTAGEPVLS